MNINKALSYAGGYYKSTEFELDIVKFSDIVELCEEDVLTELKDLQIKGDIIISNNIITLVNIPIKTNKIFNELYSPIETMHWDKHTMLKLDK